MEIALNNDLNKKISLSETFENLQETFLNKNWGEAINNAIDSGLKIILPDFIENEIIDIKNAFVKEGLVEGIKTAIDTTINKGKELIGMFTGNLENMTQAEAIKTTLECKGKTIAVLGNGFNHIFPKENKSLYYDIIKNGGLISKVADVLENIVDKTVKNGLIREGIGQLIKSGKDIILENAEKNIDKVNKEQVKKLKEMDTAIEKWNEAFKNQDFKTMQNEYKKIENRIDDIMPLEDIINKARTVENLHNLVKNNGKNFDLTEEQMQLAEQLI